MLTGTLLACLRGGVLRLGGILSSFLNNYYVTHWQRSDAVKA